METIDKIRKRLKDIGVNNRQVSVTMKSQIIYLKTKSDDVDVKEVHHQAKIAYYCDPHYWLMLNLDGRYLPINGHYTPAFEEWYK